MKNAVKKLVKRMYRFIQYFPFNNSFPIGKISIQNEGAILLKCKIVSTGRNNTIVFHSGGLIQNTVFYIRGSNNTIEIGENAILDHDEIWIEDNDNQVILGANIHFYPQVQLACTEGKTIRIGDGCLFSSDIIFRTGDSHSILDQNGHRANPAQDIEIGNHVWIGYRVLVQKGVKIADNSVVGTGAVVTKKFHEPNVILAGIPAKIVKRGTDWKAERI